MGYLDMWTVYKNPTDYPDQWVVRAWRVEGEGVRMGRALPAPTLEEARKQIPHLEVLTCFPASEGEDPAVYETWV